MDKRLPRRSNMAVQAGQPLTSPLIKPCMDKSTDDDTKGVNNTHREDGEEAIKRTSKVVPIDGGARNHESVESVAPDPDKDATGKDEKSSEVFDEFLEGIKDRNIANQGKGV